MEEQGYRENLEQLLKIFSPTKWLSISEVANALGIDKRTAKKHFKLDKTGISVSDLARRMTK
ncbi:MAG: hypothetical protein VB120_08645 [Lachnospiraceae bacterium]|nr:hypothetical protein [Lachnospiraceae bacterium]